MAGDLERLCSVRVAPISLEKHTHPYIHITHTCKTHMHSCAQAQITAQTNWTNIQISAYKKAHQDCSHTRTVDRHKERKESEILFRYSTLSKMTEKIAFVVCVMLLSQILSSTLDADIFYITFHMGVLRNLQAWQSVLNRKGEFE